MDSNQFQKELQKYKVVRLEDHYKPRVKKNELKLTTTKVLTEKKLIADKDKNIITDNRELSFWKLLETKLNEVLTPDEVASFLTEMKKNMKDVPNIINLEDLDAASATIV